MNSNISILESMVRARGLSLARINPTKDLLLPPSGTEEALEAYRRVLDHYSARLLLKEIIKSDSHEAWLKGRSSIEHFCDPRAVDDYLTRLMDLGVITDSGDGFPVPAKPIGSFGPTYEWYTAKVLASEFNCASAWGVTFEDLGSGGDHDVIASLSGRFLYIEVKTSPPGRIESPEIGGFVRRLLDIAPDMAIFHDDTHLRMKDKIVPLMESTMETIYGKRGERVHFKRLEREIFHLHGVIYIVNSKPDLRRNLEVVFRHYFRSGNAVLGAIP